MILASYDKKGSYAYQGDALNDLVFQRFLFRLVLSEKTDYFFKDHPSTHCLY